MAGRNQVLLGIVQEPVVLKIELLVGHPIWQSFPPPANALRGAVFVIDEVIDALALDRSAVDVEQPVDHFDAVAGQADHALDVVGGIVLGQAKDDYIATLRHRTENTAGNQRPPTWAWK